MDDPIIKSSNSDGRKEFEHVKEFGSGEIIERKSVKP